MFSLTKKRIVIKAEGGEAILVVGKKRSDSYIVKDLPLQRKVAYHINYLKRFIKWRLTT